MSRPKGSRSKQASPLKEKSYEDLYGYNEATRRRAICRVTHKPPYPKGSRMPFEVVERMKLSGRIGRIRGI